MLQVNIQIIVIIDKKCTDLNTFEEMQCVQSTNKMKDVFTENDDFLYIKEIISRPFFPNKKINAGKSRNTRRKNKKIKNRKSRKY